MSTTTNIKLAKTLNDATDGNNLIINEKGGLLKIVSKVSDKNSGDIGHPIQFDSSNGQWYINVSSASEKTASILRLLDLAQSTLDQLHQELL